jgi:hypothetical protein
MTRLLVCAPALASELCKSLTRLRPRAAVWTNEVTFQVQFMIAAVKPLEKQNGCATFSKTLWS